MNTDYKRKLGTFKTSGSSGSEPDLYNKHEIRSFRDGKTVALFIDDYNTPLAYYEKQNGSTYHAFIDEKQYQESSTSTTLLNNWINRLSDWISPKPEETYIENIVEVAESKSIDLGVDS